MGEEMSEPKVLGEAYYDHAKGRWMVPTDRGPIPVQQVETRYGMFAPGELAIDVRPKVKA